MYKTCFLVRKSLESHSKPNFLQNITCELGEGIVFMQDTINKSQRVHGDNQLPDILSARVNSYLFGSWACLK